MLTCTCYFTERRVAVLKEISDKLDIFLITYNRSSKLKRSLEQLLASNSPIRDFEITIVDNNSTDNTSEIVKQFQATHPNLKYTKNKYNIGGNANIARTFEQYKKDYIWILCDDDVFDWGSWQDVIDGINEGAECIIVGHCDNPKRNIVQAFAQTTFLPSSIYKTTNIDETVISNMHYNISNMFPHLAISAKIINENKTFKISNKPIVLFDGNNTLPEEKSYTRGYEKSDVHPFSANCSYIAGYANALMLIKDKKLRHQFAQKRKYITSMISTNFLIENSVNHSKSFYNIFCVFNVLDFWYKIKFIINIILYNILFRYIYIYTYEKYDERNNEIIFICRLRLFKNLFKTNLLKFRRKNKEK